MRRRVTEDAPGAALSPRAQARIRSGPWRVSPGPWGYLLTEKTRRFRESAEPAAKAHLPALFETSLPGVFAVGDVRERSVKRVASAVGEGSIAIRLVHEYLSKR
jgi:thioredoxin reductase (NADPH)